MIFIRQITKDILDEGRVKFWKHEKRTGKWKEVDFRTVQDKVSHALRDSKGMTDSVLDIMTEDNKATNPTPKPPPQFIDLSSLEPGTRASLQQLQAAQSLGPRLTPSFLPEAIDLTLEPRLRASMQHLQDLKQKNADEQRELIAAAIQSRERNLSLASMTNNLGAPLATLSMDPGQPMLSQLGGLPQFGLNSRRSMSQVSAASLPAPSPLLMGNSRQRSLDSIINQANTRNQQLSADDVLLHRMRQEHSDRAMSQLVATPNMTVSAAMAENYTATPGAFYPNQRVNAPRRLKKNLEDPSLLAGGVEGFAGQNFMEDTRQKLKLQRMAELQLGRERFRNSHN